MTHPNLQFLLQQFDHLYDAVEGGAISRESALTQLGRLQVPDGTGALWGVDAEGNFIRRAHPDAPPQLADPSQFVEARMPGGLGAGAGSPGPGPLGVPGGLGMSPGGGGFDPRSPGGAPPGWGGGPGQPVMPGSPFQDINRGVDPSVPPPAPQSADAFASGGPGPGGMESLGGFAQPPMLSSAQAEDRMIPPWERDAGLDEGMSIATARRTRGGGAGQWRERIAGRERLLAVVGVCVMVLIALALWGPRGGGSDIPRERPDEVIPSASAGLPSDSELPSDATEPAAPPPAAARVPSAGDAQRVITALTSKKRELAAAVVVAPGDEATIALETARYAGYAATGITITPGPAGAGADGQVVQEWVLTDTIRKTPIGRTQVVWVESSGWKLASWPQL